MNWRRVIPAIVVASFLAMPGLARAGPSPDAAVRIEVDVSALPADRVTEHKRKWVLEEQTAVFERAGFAVGDDASNVVRIEITSYGDYGMHTKAKLMLVGDEGSARELTCEACMDSQFVEKVTKETALLAEYMRRKAAAEPEHERTPETLEPGPQRKETTAGGGGAPASEVADDGDDDGEKRVGAAGFAGVGALVLGAGMSVGGAVVLAEEPTERLQASSARFIETVHRRPLGATLTGIGAGLLVTGVVLTVVDQTVLRKRRAQRDRVAAVAPAPLPNGVALLWTGRF